MVNMVFLSDVPVSSKFDSFPLIEMISNLLFVPLKTNSNKGSVSHKSANIVNCSVLIAKIDVT